MLSFVQACSWISFLNLNEHTGLVVTVSREDFRFLGRNSGVTLDKGSRETPCHLNIEGKRGGCFYWQEMLVEKEKNI